MAETESPNVVHEPTQPAPPCEAQATWRLECRVNGAPVAVDVPPAMTLLDALRVRLGLTGTKGACLEGECGSCTVLIDGQSACACLVLAAQTQGREVTTIEGLAQDGVLSVLQRRFVEGGAVQCGYCTPGLILAAKALLDAQPPVTEDEFIKGMEGNICRCTGYTKVFDAVRRAWAEMQAAL